MAAFESIHTFFFFYSLLLLFLFCFSLQAIQKHAANQALYRNFDGITVIKAALLAHANHDSVQKYCVNILAITELGDLHIDALFSVFQSNANNSGTLSLALSAVAALAESGRGNQSELMRSGATGLVLESMRVHLNNSNLQYWGCYALNRLAREHPENQTAIGPHAITSVLAAMRNHPRSDIVQRWGCGALFRIAGILSRSCYFDSIFNVAYEPLLSAWSLSRAL
jgi:hypothetical protein